MVDLVLLRALFQVVEQWLPGVTAIYTLLLIAGFLVISVKGSLRYTPLDLVVFAYFGLSLPINLIFVDASAGTAASYNKLLLCLMILKIVDLKVTVIKPVWIGALTSITLGLTAWAVLGSFVPSNYVSAWAVSAYIGPFESTHLLASLVTLLIASNFLLSRLADHRALVLVFFIASTALLYPLFMTGARTITFAALPIYVLQVLFFSRYLNARRRRLFAVSWVGFITVLVWSFRDQLSGLLKFETLGAEGVSNGRDAIWQFYAERAFAADWVNRVLGLGVASTVDDSAIGVGTHNDALYLQLAFGTVGLALFTAFLMEKLFSRIQPIASLALLGAALFAAFFNGFIGYTELVAAVAVARIAATWTRLGPNSLINPCGQIFDFGRVAPIRGNSVPAIVPTR